MDLANYESWESSPVKPGQGVPVERVPVEPIREALKNGTYLLDEPQQAVREALGNPMLSKAAVEAILKEPSNKGFKAAYTSLIMEQTWPAYSALATGEDPGLYSLNFDNKNIRLERQSPDLASETSLSAQADRIAASNQAMAAFYICELFKDGKVPTICGNPKKDAQYFEAFREQTDLQLSRTQHYFNTIPPYMDSPSRFVASGIQSIRTHVFGIPNLLDDVAAIELTSLTSDQHRTGVENTYNKAIMPYFFLSGPIMMAINSGFADPETQQLLPECWTSNRNLDRFLVFPRPDIVQNGNQSIARRDSLPVQTSCPVVHSRVANLEASDTLIPFTRALGQILLQQLDALYYPYR